jgi:hypothetical protein
MGKHELNISSSQQMPNLKELREYQKNSRALENAGCAKPVAPRPWTASACIVLGTTNQSFAVLEETRQLYRKQIVCVHPEKTSVSHERTIQLNGDASIKHGMNCDRGWIQTFRRESGPQLSGAIKPTRKA